MKIKEKNILIIILLSIIIGLLSGILISIIINKNDNQTVTTFNDDNNDLEKSYEMYGVDMEMKKDIVEQGQDYKYNEATGYYESQYYIDNKVIPNIDLKNNDNTEEAFELYADILLEDPELSVNNQYNTGKFVFKGQEVDYDLSRSGRQFVEEDAFILISMLLKNNRFLYLPQSDLDNEHGQLDDFNLLYNKVSVYSTADKYEDVRILRDENGFVTVKCMFNGNPAEWEWDFYYEPTKYVDEAKQKILWDRSDIQNGHHLDNK